jgi:hypothetical protein
MARTDLEQAGQIHTAAPEISDDLARLRGLLEQSDVEGARAYVKELEQRWPDSDVVRHYARVLAPPVARVVKGVPNRSFEPEFNWLRKHGREYPGCWLAVLGDWLVAADPDPRIVLKTIREDPAAKDALLHYQPRVPRSDSPCTHGLPA